MISRRKKDEWNAKSNWARTIKNEVPNFGPGDTVKVHVRIIEGKEKEYKYSKV